MKKNIVKKYSNENYNNKSSLKQINEDSISNSNLSDSSSFDDSSNSSENINNIEINKNTNNNQTQNNNQNQSVFSKERRSSLIHLISLYSDGTINTKLHIKKLIKKEKKIEKKNYVKKYKFTNIFFPKNDIEKEIYYTYEKIQNNFNPEEIITPKILFNFVKYIVSKNFYNQYDLCFLKLYLKKIQGLINLFSANENLYIEEILHKISLFLQIEKHPQNKIICFNGEIGENFYMIFEGEVSVLIPRPYKIIMNEKEYNNHLDKLYNLNEYDLLLRTIESNLYKYKNGQVLKYILEDFNLYNIPKDFDINIDDYINRVKPEKYEEKIEKNYKNFTKKMKKKEVELWGYFEVIRLNTGKTFGDVALSKHNINRTATIITTKETIFGIIDKNSYNVSIMDVQERKRKFNIEFLLSHKIFNEIKPDLFGRYYFNYFKNLKAKKGEFLFKQGEKSKEIFFIHKGEIEIFCTNTFNGINNIINRLSNNKNNNEEKDISKILEKNKNLNKIYLNEKRIFKIFISFNTEIIGLGDYYLNENYFCDAKVISNEVTYFSIEKNLLDKIIFDDIKTEKNFNEFLQNKINFMIFRLIEIKKKNFFSVYDIFKNNNENNNIKFEEQIEYFNTFRKKTILNKKNIVLKKENNLIKLNSHLNSLNLFKNRLKNFNKISQKNLLKNNTTTFDSSNLTNYKNLSNNSFNKFDKNIIRLIKKNNNFEENKNNFSLPKVSNNKINLNNSNFIIKKKNKEKQISFHKLMLSKNIPINKQKIEEMRQKKLIIDKILNNKNSLENKGKCSSESLINCLAMDDFCKTISNENNNNKEKSLFKNKILKRNKIKVLINNENDISNNFYNSTYN